MSLIVHRAPLDHAIRTPCCGRTPFELPLLDRMTTDDSKVTCEGVPVTDTDRRRAAELAQELLDGSGR